MLKFGNKEFRNLEEQVLKNQEDIQDFKDGNQTIAEFGITVVGILSSADQLPEQGENYGDAYLIGTQTPYDMRVWTRDVANNTAKWVDLGAFPLQGPKGDKGDIGSTISFGNGEPLNNPTASDQFYINVATGYWYVSFEIYSGVYQWVKRFTLKGEKGDRGEQGKQGVQGLTGPQGNTGPIGPQGVKGDKGDVGPAFNVQGTLASTSNLPTPTATMQDKGYAYIIPDTEGTKHIWVIQGPEGGPFQWVDVGTAGVGIQGPKGTDGVGLNTLTHTDLVYGDLTTTYDTVDGLTVYSTMRQTYDGTNHDSEVEYTIPIIGSDTILIDLDSGNNKLIVKLDQSKDIKLIGGSSNSVYFTSDSSASFGMPVGKLYSSFGDENGISRILNKDPGGLRTYTFPTNTYGEHTVLTSKYVKTLFGNKSIVGSGNIDLYNHDIKITGTDASIDGTYEVHVFKTSSNNLKVDSLTDLKTLLGNTFKYWNVNGSIENQLDSMGWMALYVTQSSIVFQPTNTSTPYTLSLTGATFTDTVTTV